VWLEEVGLSDFKDVFYSSGFEGNDVLRLTEDAFNRVATISADRRRIMGQKLRELQANPNNYISTSVPVKHARAVYAYAPERPGNGQLALEAGQVVGFRPPQDSHCT
jgi:hypothetical protein